MTDLFSSSGCRPRIHSRRWKVFCVRFEGLVSRRAYLGRSCRSAARAGRRAQTPGCSSLLGSSSVCRAMHPSPLCSLNFSLYVATSLPPPPSPFPIPLAGACLCHLRPFDEWRLLPRCASSRLRHLLHAGPVRCAVVVVASSTMACTPAVVAFCLGVGGMLRVCPRVP